MVNISVRPEEAAENNPQGIIWAKFVRN